MTFSITRGYWDPTAIVLGAVFEEYREDLTEMRLGVKKEGTSRGFYEPNGDIVEIYELISGEI